MAVLDDVKVLLDVSGSDLDEKLTLMISFAERRVLSFFPSGVTDVPDALLFVVTELTVARFNRVGNESMSSFSQDGESFSFSESDVAPYVADIRAYLGSVDDAKNGVVRFL
ncbi:MAG: phage head-tail connector protein [Oscillospiraceae bacterium]|nr:phage head-tail connector protein [Oscillospiraceae bacterium]MDD4511386.1 phage head-tail connector protein [Oscillospiraceae bacterium]